MQDLTIALIQADLVWEDDKANLARFESFIDRVPNGVQLIVLPEMFSTGFSMRADRLAQNMDGSATHIWRGENHISITDASIHLYHGNYHVLVDSSQVKLYSGGNAVRLGPDKISITHESEVKITVGGSSVKLTPGDVEVNAPTVKITGGVTEIRGTPVKVNC